MNKPDAMVKSIIKNGTDAARSASAASSARAGDRAAPALPDPAPTRGSVLLPLLVLLATIATAALCAWFAHSVYERQARLSDAQRLGVYRDLQASRLIEYFSTQRQALRTIASQFDAQAVGNTALSPATPGGFKVIEPQPALGDLARSAGLAQWLIAEIDSGQVLWSETLLTDKAAVTSPSTGDSVSASMQQALSSLGAQPDELTLQAYTDQSGLMQAWYAIALDDSQGQYALLASTLLPSLLTHLRDTPVDPAPFANEAPEIRLLVGNDHAGLDEALLRESLRTPARIMSVTVEDASKPALAALRRLEIDANQMTLAVVKDRQPIWPMIEPVIWPAAAGCALIGLLLALLASRASRRSLRLPAPITRTVNAVQLGDFSSRTGLSGPEDFSGYGEALDMVLDERATALSSAGEENAELNESVVRIMESVGTMASTRDLSVRVPVTEDVTGAISDALNMLTEETGRTLAKVNTVSHELERTTLSVRAKGELAMEHVSREREDVERAATEIGSAATAISSAAQMATSAQSEAQAADAKSLLASNSVRATANGVMKARDLVRQAEKQLKRLGEHTQEISQVVGIIESISERTGILALNTSLQAAAAGEAGRQFGGLADEIKRLSKSAGQATAQIGRMVSAIQTETADTVGAVGGAIGQIVEISEQVSTADNATAETRREISSVVDRIESLKATVDEQAQLSLDLQARSGSIASASDRAVAELTKQAEEMGQLTEHARTLIREVGAFKTGHSQ
ncbi:MAG: methyl-accepting chemotaxis protein [Burkholderiaceae bacterium]